MSDETTDTGGTNAHPLGALVRGYASDRGAAFGLGLVLLVLARIPQRVPALVIGVALDALLIGTVAFDLPLVPQHLLPDEPTGQIALTVAILLGAVLAESALDWFSRLWYDRATLRTLHDVRTGTYNAVMGLEMRVFDDRERGDVMSVLNNDVDNVEEFAQGTYDGVTYASEILVAFAFMLLLSWQLALFVAVLPVVLGVTSRLYASLLSARYDAVRESVGSVNARLEGSIEGIGTVKANAREDHERERVAERSAGYRDARWSALKLRIGYDATTWLVGRSGERALLVLGGYWVIAGPPLFFSGTLTAGTLLTFLMYSRSFLHPVRNFAVRVIDRFANARASGARIQELVSHSAVETADADAPEIEVEEGRVAYDGVTFAYDGADEPTVEDVSFTAEPGELVGIVGSTGAGKSTITKLLFRFYDPDAGTIRVDGTDVAGVSRRSLRAHLGYVSQDPFLFHGTVRENVAYARPEASEEAVIEAATLAGAHEFVSELPDGYDTQVGERGVKLSGGQRQRLAIARAILRDPAILVLDEATSHVDNETELQIQRSLGALAGDRTTFAIAHRLSTVRDADRILVVDDGRIIAEGTHEQLLERDGVYADLWRVQVGEVAAVSDRFVERAEGVAE